MTDVLGRALAVGARERALLGPELAAFLENLRDQAVRTRYAVLADALAAGDVPESSVPLLESFLELGLTTGRFRDRLGQHGEDVLRRLYERTPRGAAQAASAEQVTEALRGLVDQTVRDVRLSLVRPGAYRLVLETDRLRVSLALGPAGANVESLELTL